MTFEPHWKPEVDEDGYRDLQRLSQNTRPLDRPPALHASADL